MKYKITNQMDTTTVSAFLDGELYVANSTHPNFDSIVDALINFDGNENAIVDMFDVSRMLIDSFNSLSDSISFQDGKVYYEDKVVDNSLSDQIIRFMEQKEDFGPLVRFMEKVFDNPNVHSREQLYTWLRDREFAITEDGNFIAYKSVWAVENQPWTLEGEQHSHKFKSVSAGRALVDGIEYNGQIPQSIGSVISMPRSEVTFNPEIGCHTGLHAGTLEYAETFSGDTVVLVEINPRDVVSVPVDCEAQKLRVSSYTIKGICEGAVKRVVVFNDNWYDLFDDDDEPDFLAEYWGENIEPNNVWRQDELPF